MIGESWDHAFGSLELSMEQASKQGMHGISNQTLLVLSARPRAQPGRWTRHLYSVAAWYPISICIWADIPNCYRSVYGPLPHLQVWYSLCIRGYKSSHLSPHLLLDRLADLSQPSIPSASGSPLVSSHPHWADIPNYRGSVYGPLPHLLVRYSRPSPPSSRLIAPTIR